MKKFKNVVLTTLLIGFSIQAKGSELILTEPSNPITTPFISKVLYHADILDTTLNYLELKDFVRLSELSKTTSSFMNTFFQNKEQEAQAVYQDLASSTNSEGLKRHFIKILKLAQYSPTALRYSSKLFQDLGIYETDGTIQVHAKLLGSSHIDSSTLLTFPSPFPVKLSTLLEASKKFEEDTTQTLDIFKNATQENINIKRSIRNLNIWFDQSFNIPTNVSVDLSFENVKIRINNAIFRPRNSTDPLVNVAFRTPITFFTPQQGNTIETNGNIDILYQQDGFLLLSDELDGINIIVGQGIIISPTTLETPINRDEHPFRNRSIPSIPPAELQAFQDSCDIIFSSDVRLKTEF